MGLGALAVERIISTKVTHRLRRTCTLAVLAGPLKSVSANSHTSVCFQWGGGVGPCGGPIVSGIDRNACDRLRCHCLSAALEGFERSGRLSQNPPPHKQQQAGDTQWV